MAKAIRVSKRISRIPNTISGLLTRDDVNKVLEDVCKFKSDIKDIVVVYTVADGEMTFFHSSTGTLTSKAVWMLESTKMDLLRGNFEED